MANYPGERPVGSRRARPRKQRMFAQRVAAEEFLEAARREYFQKGRVELAYDRELHSDVLRAVKILAEVVDRVEREVEVSVRSRGIEG